MESKTKKEIGKIKSVQFGFGGYQEAMIGLSIELGSDKASWGVGDFKGYWATEHSKSCKWSEQDRHLSLGETVMWISQLLSDAHKTDISQLKGVPVEVTFDGNSLKEWRILTEAI